MRQQFWNNIVKTETAEKDGNEILQTEKRGSFCFQNRCSVIMMLFNFLVYEKLVIHMLVNFQVPMVRETEIQGVL